MTTQRKHRPHLAALELLESRQFLSTVSLSQGILSITGDAATRNTIDVSYNSDRSRIVVTTNGTARSYVASQVNSLKITGGNAQDTVTVSSAITKRATLNGGSGNDILRGGGGADSINGGAGDDWIDGGPGADRTDGGAGDDTYVNDASDTVSVSTGDYVVRSQPTFNTYDATLFSNKPDTTQYGLKGIILAYSQIFANGNYSTPNEAATRAFARSVANLGKPVVFDIENWPVDIRTATTAQVNASITKLTQIVDWMHSEAPNVKVGFYGIMPLRDYWTPVLYASYSASNPTYAQQVWLPKYQAWQAANDKLKPLAAKVDFIVPSLYTFYDDQSAWETYAAANIAEARRYGKPVSPFLMMYYHDSNATLGSQPLPTDAWQQEIDLTRANSDGVVIWGGWQVQWDPNAGWWTVVHNALTQNQAAPTTAIAA